MYKKSSKGILKHIDFAFLDLFSLFVSFVSAFLIRFESLNKYPSITDSLYLNMFYVLLFADIFVLVFLETLKNVLKRGIGQELYLTIRHVAVLGLIGSFYLYSAKVGENYSRLLFSYTIVIYFVTSLVTRLIWKKYLITKSKGKHKRMLLIVTTSDRLNSIIEKVNEYAFGNYQIMAIALLDVEHIEKNIDGVNIIGIDDGVIDILNYEWIDEVLINVSPDKAFPDWIMKQCILAGITVHTCLTRVSSIPGKQQFVGRVGSFDVITTASNYLTPKQAIWKRFIDILGGIVGCLITLLIIIFIGPILFISDPGPLFFAQERIGLNGKKFRIYKFRSMYKDAEARKNELMAQNKVEDGMMFKMDFDPRIIGNKELPDGKRKTGIGQFIRDTSLDEFPQFFNVIKGDMSIVGTRPPTVDEWEKYELHHRSRLATKPGITGMWQTSGRSEITDFEEVIKLDNEYISEWDIWLDFKIIFKTIKVVLTREGSQ